MRSIFNGDVKVFETHGDSQKDTKSVREGAQRVPEGLDCVCGRKRVSDRHKNGSALQCK